MPTLLLLASHDSPSQGGFEEELMLTERLEPAAQRRLPRTDHVHPSPAVADGVLPLSPASLASPPNGLSPIHIHF